MFDEASAVRQPYRYSGHISMLPFKTIFRAASGLVLIGMLLVGLAKVLGELIPPGEQLPVTVWREPVRFNPRNVAHPNISMVDLSRNLSYRLTRGDFLGVTPELSPDGTQVVFASYAHPSLYITDLLTGIRRQISSQEALYSLPAWSPDASQIAFSATSAGSTEIYLMNLADGTLRQLTSGFGPDTHPAWSPDGRFLAYISSNGFDPANIYVMPLDCPEADDLCGLVARPMTDQPGYDWALAWSPDGRQIAFASDRGGGNDIYVMDTDCLNRDANTVCLPNVRPMTNQRFPNGITQLAWSRDGRQLRFVLQVGLDGVIYALDAGCDVSPDGCTLHQLAVIP
jgi:Tol biopolymer transport system component